MSDGVRNLTNIFILLSFIARHRENEIILVFLILCRMAIDQRQILKNRLIINVMHVEQKLFLIFHQTVGNSASISCLNSDIELRHIETEVFDFESLSSKMKENLAKSELSKDNELTDVNNVDTFATLLFAEDESFEQFFLNRQSLDSFAQHRLVIIMNINEKLIGKCLQNVKSSDFYFLTFHRIEHINLSDLIFFSLFMCFFPFFIIG